jgi:valyl-tRNA synthetase
MQLPKVYEPAQYENDIYALWEKSGAFQADPDSHKERFTISMPPPNATGTLHLGHSIFITLQDIMIRYARMQGKDALWVPGTDHAALPVNAIMEKTLATEGTNKHEIGREEFLRRTIEFVEASRDTMRTQIRAMGASCDWSRERYTLDETLSRIVSEVFVKMYNDGLIYRGHRIVNWDPNLETTVSDDEVERKEEKTTFYTFQYGPFQISTARPETKFGDKYVVMHPGDERYKQYKHGDTFEAEWINGKVLAMVIKDEAVDPAFGTGVMTITPWHDHTDFEIAERHNLDKEQIIDFHGNLLPIAGEFAGMHITEARPLIVEKLREKGLLIGEDKEYMHSLAVNERGKGVIEPQIKLQWFVDVNKPVVEWKGKKRTLKEVMRAVIDDGDITIVPDRFNKVYFHWIDNLRDWCVSRQIWWGHRIPAWYRESEDRGLETYVGTTPPADDGKEGWHAWEQDPDTLDTWFSSALWTWSTLVDPELAKDMTISLSDLLKKSRDYQTYHPTDVMETGWDILFFWVARMILSTTYATGQIPFKTVYLHGLVRAEDGSKMSKSHPETIIDPLEVIPEFGTDALRLALISGLSAGNDQRLGKSKIADKRNFCNKLWNVARFVEDKLGDDFTWGNKPTVQTAADAWIMSKLQHATQEVASLLDEYRFSDASNLIYHLLWDDFADWYIEASKTNLNKEVLAYSLETILKLAHPFVPFVTETIWQTFRGQGSELLMTSAWPKAVKVSEAEAATFEDVKNIVNEIRFIRGVLHLRGDISMYHSGDQLVRDQAGLIKSLTRLDVIKEVRDGHGLHLTSTSRDCWLDLDQESTHNFVVQLKLKQAEQAKIVAGFRARLANKSYTQNAPKAIVEETREKLAEAEALLQKVTEEYERFASQE